MQEFLAVILHQSSYSN